MGMVGEEVLTMDDSLIDTIYCELMVDSFGNEEERLLYSNMVYDSLVESVNLNFKTDKRLQFIQNYISELYLDYEYYEKCSVLRDLIKK